MPDQLYHSGGEGTVVVDGVDWNVTDADGTETTTYADTTNTSDYDTADKVVYQRRIATKKTFAGSFTMGYDSNNSPVPKLRNSVAIAAVITFSTGIVFTGNVTIESLQIRKGGMEGKVEVVCNYTNQSKYLLA